MNETPISRFPMPSEEELRDLYWVQYLNHAQIAGRFGVSRQLVVNWFARLGIPTRKAGEKSRPRLPVTPHPTVPNVAMVPLTNGGYALIDEDDVCRVDEYQWFKYKASEPGSDRWYARATADSERGVILMH